MDRERRRLRALWKPERALRSRGYRRPAGVDESGRGPLAGPVVAVAMILPHGCFIPGLNDSKRLSATRREEIAQEIRECAIAMGIGIGSVELIERVNIMQATHQAMREALQGLTSSPDCVLVDGRPLPGISLPQRAIVKGDSLSASIAAASIIAKQTRDQIMLELDELYPEYGFARHKGYCTPEHVRNIDQFGICPAHRKTFQPVADVLREMLPMKEV